MYNIPAECNLKWNGHLNRREDSTLTKQILYFKLREGSRRTRRPKPRHKQFFKRDTEAMNILLENWQYLSKNVKIYRKNQVNIYIYIYTQISIYMYIYIYIFIYTHR